MGSEMGSNRGPRDRSFYGYSLPKGKYDIMGEDDRGFYYKAPDGVLIDGNSLVPGGIYWEKSKPVPENIYFDYDGDTAYPEIKHFKELGREIVIPNPGDSGRGIDASENY